MRSHTIRYSYVRSSFEARKHPSLAPVHELIGFQFDYVESYTEVISSGIFFERGRGYCATPQIDITLRLDLAPPSSVFLEHFYEYSQREALAIMAILCTEIPSLPWEYEP